MVNDSLKWQAIVDNDKHHDGCFFYAVKSTGIFCNPSCKSRMPSKENVVYFDSAEEAKEAGYRACKRCRPDLHEFQPMKIMAEETKLAIETYYNKREKLSKVLDTMGITQHRLVEVFRQYYHMTPSQYADELRIRAAKERLINSNDSLINIAFLVGFDSVSAFYGFFYKHLNMTPSEYRQQHCFDSRSVESKYSLYETSIGNILISANDFAVDSIRFETTKELHAYRKPDRLTDQAAKQIEEYISGTRQHFDFPLRLSGTKFQQTVWKELQNIPYGETWTYKQVAQKIGAPNASRAVGMANNKNPILIVIPCHRVVGSDGSPKGYAGGIEVKKKLLELENKFRRAE